MNLCAACLWHLEDGVILCGVVKSKPKADKGGTRLAYIQAHHPTPNHPHNFHSRKLVALMLFRTQQVAAAVLRFGLKEQQHV